MFVSSVLNPEHPSLCDDVEQMCTSLIVACCVVTCKHHCTAVVSIYRSPSISAAACIAELRSVLLQLSFNVHYILMAGDFNINLLSTNDASTREYVDLLIHGLSIDSAYITGPTHVIGSSATLIDHIISTSSLTICNTFQASGVSDHRMQVADFSVPLLKSPLRPMWVRSFKKCNWAELKATLHSAPWQLMDLFNDLDNKWSFFPYTVASSS